MLSKAELIAKTRSRYWKQCVEKPAETKLVPLVMAVLDENGMANDPAYYETISDICSTLASYDHRQLSLPFS